MEKLFGVDVLSNLEPRYNVAPSQDVLLVRHGEDRPEAIFLKWGLVPAWSKDITIGYKTVNARGESLAEKPAFREAYARRRCLIPADGFYEWDASLKARPPYRFVLKDQSLMAIAGLWERNEALGVTSFTIVTTVANSHLRDVGHDRMGLLIAPEDQQAWLDPDTGTDRLEALMKPFPDDLMAHFMVGTIVNNPRNDVPACLDPVDGPDQGDLFG